MQTEFFRKIKSIITEDFSLQKLGQGGLAGAGLAGLSRAERFCHFWVFSIKSFVRNRCMVRASALAYSSLLALVPMLAIVISVSVSILNKQGEQPILDFVDHAIVFVIPETTAEATGQGSPKTNADNLLTEKRRQELVTQIKEFIGNIRSGALTAGGSALLVFIVISMLSRIENTFNDIWGVEKGRNWVSRITQYWAALTLGPIFLVATLSINSGQELKTFKEAMLLWPYGVGATIQFMFRLLPFVILSIGFTLFYKLMPNTRVNWRAAFVGGVVGGSLLQMNNLLGVLFVSRFATNHKIYGGMVMLPMLMIALYFSWLSILFGAQVAYAFQNRRSYVQDRLMENLNNQGREILALRIMTEAAHKFYRGDGPMSALTIAENLKVPSRLVISVVQALQSNRLLYELNLEEPAYLPARPLRNITFQDVIQAIRVGQSDEIGTGTEAGSSHVERQYQKVLEAEKMVANEVNLNDLVESLLEQEASAPPSSETVAELADSHLASQYGSV